MSERKTAEIKFRIEPSVKARWQEAADAIEDGLSEFIRRCVEQSILQHEQWTKENARLDGTKLLGNAIDAITEIDPAEAQFATVLNLNPDLPEGELWIVDMDEVKLERTQPVAIIKNITDASPANPALLPNEDKGGLREFISTDVSEARPPLTREALDDAWFGPLKSEKSVPKSWMFEGRHG